MGITLGMTYYTEAPMTPHLRPHLYHSGHPMSKSLKIDFFLFMCKEGSFGETPHSVIKEFGIMLSYLLFFSDFAWCFTMGDVVLSQIRQHITAIHNN